MIDVSPLIRWIVLAALIAASGLYGWTRGANHAMADFDAYRRSIESAADRQLVRVRLIESRQQAITTEVQNETVSRIARSDSYYRLHWPNSNPVSLPSVPGSPTPADGSPKASAPDTAGCNPADGAADALVIIGWQEWYRHVSAQSVARP